MAQRERVAWTAAGWWDRRSRVVKYATVFLGTTLLGDRTSPKLENKNTLPAVAMVIKLLWRCDR